MGTCTPTPLCLVAPPCTLVLLTVCRRRSPPLLPPPSRSRLLLPLRGNTLYGSEDLSCLPCPPSSRCGSPSRSTMSVAHPLSTGSASKLDLSQACDILSYIFFTSINVVIRHTFRNTLSQL